MNSSVAPHYPEKLALLESESNPQPSKVWGFVGKTALLFGIGVGGSAIGLTQEPTNVHLGPHEAEVTLTLSDTNTIDAGPIGKIALPSDLPGKLGTNIRMGAIPISDAPKTSENQNFDELIEQYQLLISNPEADIAEAQNEIYLHALKLGLLSTTFGLALGIASSRLLGTNRREELKQHFIDGLSSTKTKSLAGAGLLVTSMFYPAVNSQAAQQTVPIDRAFEGTPLEGAQISGEIMRFIINEQGSKFLDFLEKNEIFYDKVSSKLEQAFAFHVAPPGSDTIRAIADSDNHCNIGMSGILAEAVRLGKAKIEINAGDLTMRGTAAEVPCVRATAKIAADKVIALGNHDDSLTTGKQVRDNGYKILDGKVVQVQGLHFLGDNDPRRSDFTPIHYVEDETVEAVGTRLGTQACTSEEEIDVVVIHSPTAAQNVIAEKCAKLVITGHRHKYKVTNGPYSMIINVGTSGGAAEENLTVGALNNDATFVILDFNKSSGDLQSYQLVTVKPDTSVIISDAITIQESRSQLSPRGYF